MSKLLFLNQPAVGHLNVLLSIATQMKEDGHDVRFLAPVVQGIRTNSQILDTGLAIPNRIKRLGLICELIRPHPSLVWNTIGLPYKSGHNEVIHAYNIFSEGLKHYTQHILKFIETYRPDILVTDFSFPAATVKK